MTKRSTAQKENEIYRTGYHLFYAHHRKSMLYYDNVNHDTPPYKNMLEMSRRCAENWRALSDEEKEYWRWRALSDEDKEFLYLSKNRQKNKDTCNSCDEQDKKGCDDKRGVEVFFGRDTYAPPHLNQHHLHSCPPQQYQYQQPPRPSRSGCPSLQSITSYVSTPSFASTVPPLMHQTPGRQVMHIDHRPRRHRNEHGSDKWKYCDPHDKFHPAAPAKYYSYRHRPRPRPEHLPHHMYQHRHIPPHPSNIGYNFRAGQIMTEKRITPHADFGEVPRTHERDRVQTMSSQDEKRKGPSVPLHGKIEMAQCWRKENKVAINNAKDKPCSRPSMLRLEVPPLSEKQNQKEGKDELRRSPGFSSQITSFHQLGCKILSERTPDVPVIPYTEHHEIEIRNELLDENTKVSCIHGRESEGNSDDHEQMATRKGKETKTKITKDPDYTLTATFYSSPRKENQQEEDDGYSAGTGAFSPDVTFNDQLDYDRTMVSYPELDDFTASQKQYVELLAPDSCFSGSSKTTKISITQQQASLNHGEFTDFGTSSQCMNAILKQGSSANDKEEEHGERTKKALSFDEEESVFG